MKLEIQFNVTEQDYVYFNIDHYFSSGALKWQRILLKFAPPVLFFALTFVLEGFKLSIGNVIAAFIFFSLWIVLFPKIMEKSMSKVTLAYVKSGKANDFIGPQTLKLTDSHIEEHNAGITSQIQYSTVERVFSGHGLLYIYIGAVKAIILPVSAFPDEEGKKAFLQLLSNKTGQDFSRLI